MANTFAVYYLNWHSRKPSKDDFLSPIFFSNQKWLKRVAEDSAGELHKLKGIKGIKWANGKPVDQSSVNTLSNNSRTQLEKSKSAACTIIYKKQNQFPCIL